MVPPHHPKKSPFIYLEAPESEVAEVIVGVTQKMRSKYDWTHWVLKFKQISEIIAFVKADCIVWSNQDFIGEGWAGGSITWICSKLEAE